MAPEGLVDVVKVASPPDGSILALVHVHEQPRPKRWIANPERQLVVGVSPTLREGLVARKLNRQHAVKDVRHVPLGRVILLQHVTVPDKSLLCTTHNRLTSILLLSVDTSTTRSFSTNSGHFNAAKADVRPPIEWPMRMARSRFRRLWMSSWRSRAIASYDIEVT